MAVNFQNSSFFQYFEILLKYIFLSKKKQKNLIFFTFFHFWLKKERLCAGIYWFFFIFQYKIAIQEKVPSFYRYFVPMFFHFIGIKDISEKNYTLDLLFEAEDISQIKDFLNFHKAITLSLEEYTQDPQNFGSVYMVIQFKEFQFKIITQFDSVQSCLDNVIPLELTLIEVNDTKSPLSPIEYQDLIVKWNQAHQAELQKIREQKEKKQKAEANLSDPRLQKAYHAIEEIINQIEQVQAIWGDKIEPITRKKLEDMRWIISKLRLATNYDKIIEDLHKAMNLIVATQDFLLERLEADKIFPIFEWTQVQNTEIIREQTRLAKAQLLQALGAQLSREESMYVSLGYLKLFSEYLQKDLTFAFQNKLPIVKNFCKALEVTSLLMIIECALLLVLSPFIGIEFWVKNFAIALLYIAPFALLIWIFNHKVKPQSLNTYGIWLFWGLLLYMSIIAFLRTLLIF